MQTAQLSSGTNRNSSVSDRRIPEEPQPLLEAEFNGVIEMIAAAARAAPFNTALAMGPDRVTFGELELRAGKLAAHLRSLGVGPETVVGVYMERSPESVIAALGIWKAGGAYLPLDTANPAARLALMLEDARAPFIVASRPKRLPRGPWRTVDFNAVRGAGKPQIAPQPEHLAYVIYTSGSAGRPKGVEITHGSLCNLVGWHRRAFQISAIDRTSQVASLGFDAAVWEIWPALCAGASVHFADAETRTSPAGLRDWIIREGITVGFFPTPLAEQMLALDWPASTRLRTMLTGADTLHQFPPFGLPFTLVNNYGPTECTVVATSGIVEPRAGADRPSIGRPIDGARIHILDGEIHIGGAGVARGYRNHPELTNSRFIPDPFSREPGARMYRTGDLGQWLPDGRIAFLGRADDQIKIRGCRIQPEEIVTVLNRFPGLHASSVVAREIEGEPRLVAYVAPEQLPPDSELRDFLKLHLPDYMLPDSFVRLASLPLTANGKIDRAAIPSLNPARPENACEAIEPRLTALVQDLLGQAKVDREDNFFLLGGHSLLGAQLLARVRQSFHLELSLRALFEAPTIASLSARIASRTP